MEIQKKINIKFQDKEEILPNIPTTFAKLKEAFLDSFGQQEHDVFFRYYETKRYELKENDNFTNEITKIYNMEHPIIYAELPDAVELINTTMSIHLNNNSNDPFHAVSTIIQSNPSEDNDSKKINDKVDQMDEELKSTISKLNEEIQNTQKLKEQCEKFEEMQNMYKHMDSNNSNKSNIHRYSSKDVKKQIDGYIKKNKELLEQNNELNEKIKEINNIVESYKTKNKILIDEKQNLKQEINKLNDIINNFKKEDNNQIINELLDNNRDLSEKVSKLEKENSDYQIQIQEIKNKYTNMEKSLNNKDKRIDELNQKIKEEYNKYIKNLNNLTQNHDKRIMELTKSIDDIEAQKNELNKTNQILKTEIDNKNKIIEDINEKNEKEKKNLKENIEKLKKDIESIKIKQNNDLEHNENKAQEKEVLIQKLEKLEKQNDEIKSKLNNIKQNNSKDEENLIFQQQIDILYNELEMKNIQLSEANNNTQELLDKLDQFNKEKENREKETVEQISKIEADKIELENKLELQKKEISDLKNQIKNINDEKNKLISEKNDLNKKLQEKIKDIININNTINDNPIKIVNEQLEIEVKELKLQLENKEKELKAKEDKEKQLIDEINQLKTK